MFRGPEYGLQLSARKCELWWPSGPQPSWDVFPPEVMRVLGSGVDLLCPLGDALFAQEYVQRRLNKIASTLETIESIQHGQYEILLLRFCAGIPRFVYSLRTTNPLFIKDQILDFDRMVDSALQHLFGGHGLDTIHRELVGLPLRMGD
jgi:hypothetical protein